MGVMRREDVRKLREANRKIARKEVGRRFSSGAVARAIVMYEKGASLEACAEYLKCGDSTFRDRLARLGIHIRTCTETHQLKARLKKIREIAERQQNGPRT